MSALLGALVILITSCGGGDELSSTAVLRAVDSPTPQAPGELSMGGEALGGSAVTTLLAQGALAAGETAGRLAWIAHEVRLDVGEALEHSHEFTFVYAKDGTHVLTEGADRRRLAPTEGAVISSEALHRHEALESPSVFWEVRVAAPGSGPPPKASNARLVFESEPLKGIPSPSLGAFVLVLVPPGGRTSVHTHPGPELIFQLSGRIEYENALIGARDMGPGEIEGIPPSTPVQKRNSSGADAEFLSWFLVDPVEPFASPARFPTPDGRGDNLASMERGARIVGVSSNFGKGSDDSAFGALNALDGDPSTEWSSNGDGDGGWIEIELPTETHVTAIGFWSRTMGASAEIFSFRVITDGGEVYGPFDLADSVSIHYFETDLTARRLRFENVDSSGGNTGALEIEVYGEPVP